jgi:hypothetical protein
MDADAPPTIRRRNPRLQGEIGLGAAIAWFTANGYCVAIPLADNQPYDLVVDGPDGLQRVQVKTTTRRQPKYGSYVVQLETAGGNQSFHTRKPFDNTAVDLLFVLADDGSRWLFPTHAITAKRALNLSPRYVAHRMVPPESRTCAGPGDAGAVRGG